MAKLYIVTAKCGHVGKYHFIDKKIPITAESKRDAAKAVRNEGRVKHDHKDAIRNVIEVTEDEYREAVQTYNSDPYFRCHNIQQQRELCPDLILQRKRCEEEKESRKNQEEQTIFRDGQKIRKPKRYLKEHFIDKEYLSDWGIA